MPKFSKLSEERLKTIHPDLQKVLREAIKTYDFTILEGIRTKEKQEELLSRGMSRTLNSKHLDQGDGYSHAVDIAPWPIDWNDRERFILLSGFVKGLGAAMGVKLRLGVDWDSDLNIKEHSLFDGPHLELED